MDPTRWRGLLADPAVTLLLAEEGGELLGFTACGESRDSDVGPEVGEVRTLFYEAHGFTRDGAERTEEAWADIPQVRYRRALA